MRAAGAVAGLIFLIVVISISRRSEPTYPVSDEAVIELATLNASHGRQFLGPYSRYPWHHPGPVLFYALAPFYEASGRTTTGLAAGALTINAAVLALGVWVLFRRGGPALALSCGAALALFVTRIPEVLVSAWNAHIAAPAAAVAVIVSASTASGWLTAIPVFVALASMAVQTHVATVPLVAVAGVAVTVILSKASNRRQLRATLTASVCVCLALWLLPLVEQLTAGGGNIGRMAHFAAQSSVAAPWPAAVEAWAGALVSPFRPGFDVPRGVLVPLDGAGWPEGLAIVQILLLAATAWWARANSRPMHMWLAAELLLITVAALAAVSRIPDGIHDHEVFWIAGVGVLSAATILAAPLAALADRARWRIVWAGALVIMVGSICLAGTRELVGLAERSHAPSRDDRLIQALTQAVRDEIARAGARRPKIVIDQRVWVAAAGVILQLRKAGQAVAVEPDLAHMFSGTLPANGSEDLELAFCGGPCHERLAARPGNTVVWLADGIAIDAIAQ